jgi:Trk K+ transport system NAD-binding subunit
VSDVAWSPGTVVISVQRDGQLVLVNGATHLQSGDLVSALTHPRTEDALRNRLHGPA